MKMKEGFEVLLMPKHKGVPERILKPNKNDISWSRTRAEKEAKFLKKNARFGNESMPHIFDELYRYKIVKSGKH